MIVLGIGGSTHDFSACVVVDGRVVIAVEEERLSRIKHHSLERLQIGDFRLRAVDYCLDELGIGLADVDRIVANDLVYRGALRGLPAVEPINHHLSHAALVSYLSPVAEQAILVVDGFGSIKNGRAETVSYFVAGADRLPILVHRETGTVHRIAGERPFSWKNFDFVENSLGEFYSFVTRSVGFGPHDEGKTMGLAPYGTGRLASEFRELVPVDEIGGITFGKNNRAKLSALIAAEWDGSTGWERRADLARAAQELLELSLVRRFDDLHRRTGQTAVGVGGGVFLNSVANRRLRDSGPFQTFQLHGATGDSGTAIGAALLAFHQATGQAPQGEQILYTGKQYGRTEILAALQGTDGIAWTDGEVCRRAAEVLAAGGIVGWFQGRSEFGPRALGNRSILADPGRPGMKDRINSLVKHREDFRPFAPSILGGRQGDILDTTDAGWFMCVNAHVRTEAAERLAAASHVDASARYQTVTPESNPRFHELIERFDALTGTPALLNTSFNDSEPIVESPADALACFIGTSLDCLVLGDFFVTKGSRPDTPVR